jgi:hypothetical protein
MHAGIDQPGNGDQAVAILDLGIPPGAAKPAAAPPQAAILPSMTTDIAGFVHIGRGIDDPDRF